MNGPVLMIVAHPDDEVLGAGAQLASWKDNLHILHATDGAPRNMSDAISHGFSERASYAQQRRRELESALALAGVPASRAKCLGLVDQEVSFHLYDLAQALAGDLEKQNPALIITHPYEGGHPDHDAVAFGVHAAVRLFRRNGRPTPNVVEMTCYHNRNGVMATGEFLDRSECPMTTFELTVQQQEFKRSLLACFVTQRRVLEAFGVERERFRPAPTYDFSQVPHPGTLYYEMFDWAINGTQWRDLAANSLRMLGLSGQHSIKQPTPSPLLNGYELSSP